MKRGNATAAYSLIQMATWGFYAVPLSFSSNFLHHYGFKDAQISLFLGVSTALSCVLQLGVAEIISRTRKLSAYSVLLCMGSLMLAGAAAILNPWSEALRIMGLAMSCTILQAIPAMSNSVGMEAVERGSNTNYSVARGFGSLAYSILALVTGWSAARFGVCVIGVLGGISAVILLASAMWYHAVSGQENTPSVPKEVVHQKSSFLKENRTYMLFLAGCILLYISHNLVCNFMFQIISAKGGGSSQQGIATAIAAITEIPVMFGFVYLLRWMRCEKWVQMSAAFFMVKAIGLYLAADCSGVYVVQMVQLLGYALFSISSVHYAKTVTGKGEAVRAQSYLASTAAIGSLIASSTGGILCQYFSAQIMILAASAAGAVGAVVVTIAVRRGERRHCTSGLHT